jgi:hypothetical protein
MYSYAILCCLLLQTQDVVRVYDAGEVQDFIDFFRQVCTTTTISATVSESATTVDRQHYRLNCYPCWHCYHYQCLRPLPLLLLAVVELAKGGTALPHSHILHVVCSFKPDQHSLIV